MLRIEVHNRERWLHDASGRSLVRIRPFSDLTGAVPEEVFVIASGPSTSQFPFRRYCSHRYITMNGSIVAAADHGITPFFYLCDDEGFAHNRCELALQGLASASHVAMSLQVLSVLHAADNECLEGKSIFLLERVNRFVGQARMSDRAFAWSIRKNNDLVSDFSLFRRAPNRIGFSRNLDQGYFVARTIAYVALQLCYQLGSPKVLMVGFDLSSGKGRFYEASEECLKSSLDEDYDKYIMPCFRLMSRYIVESPRFQVFNLSADSRLPHYIVPKISISDIDKVLFG